MSEISELFATDPLKLSEQDITKIVESIRGQRHRFVAGNKSAGSMKPKTAAAKKGAAAAKITGKLDLSSFT
jgi:hypothetical protein